MTGGIFGKLQFPMEEPEYKKVKNNLLKEIEIKINGDNSRVTIDEKGYFWILDIPTGDYDIEYFHPDYGTHKLKNIEVRRNKLTMVILSLLTKNMTLEIDRMKDWKKENMAFLPNVNPQDRGAIKIKLKRKLSATFVNLRIPDDPNVLWPNYRATMWFTEMVDTQVVIEDILPGIYSVYVHIFNFPVKYFDKVPVKKDTISIIDNVFPPMDHAERGDYVPKYKKRE